MLCPTCRYNLDGLPERPEPGGRPAITCPECGRRVSPAETPRRRSPWLFVVMLFLPWALVTAFTFRTGDTMSDADAELTGMVLPWTAPCAAAMSVAGGALLVSAGKSSWSWRRRVALVAILVANAALLAFGWFIAIGLYLSGLD